MDEPQQKTLRATFCRTSSGTETVREWLKRLDAQDRRIMERRSARSSLAGTSVCRCAARGAAACMRSAAQSRESGFPAFYSAFTV